MAETPGQQTAAAPEDPGGTRQTAVDALPAQNTRTAAERTIAASPPTPAASIDDANGMNQADLDALLGAAAMETEEFAAEAGVDSTGEPFDATAAAPPPHAQRFDFPEFSGPATVAVDAKRVTMLNDVNLRVKLVLGRTRMLLEDVLKLGEGSVVELDKLAGDPIDVYANERLIARGEVLVLNDNFCVRISEVFSSDPHRVSL